MAWKQSKAGQQMLAYLAYGICVLKKYSTSPTVTVALLIASCKLQTYNKMFKIKNTAHNRRILNGSSFLGQQPKNMAS